MSGFLTKATLIGTLGRDPDIFLTQTGSRIVTLSIATNETCCALAKPCAITTVGERSESPAGTP